MPLGQWEVHWQVIIFARKLEFMNPKRVVSLNLNILLVLSTTVSLCFGIYVFAELGNIDRNIEPVKHFSGLISGTIFLLLGIVPPIFLAAFWLFFKFFRSRN